ncbi:MAG: acyl-CoA thioesterase [Bacteroidetes bacterium]|nr:acyl-CoA thioesterase [Bacteroidota bacterium]
MKNKLNRIKTPKDSETIVTEVVCPNDTNPMGILQGGKLVQWMDIASAVCAQNHAEHICVTASIDNVLFKTPAKIGDIVTIKAKMTRTFNSSMEIFVQAWAKKVVSQKAYLINEAYFTFVAIDDNGNPANEIIAIKPKTIDEKKQFDEAAKRKTARLKK